MRSILVKIILWLLQPLRQARRRYAPRLGLSLVPKLGAAFAFARYGWRRSFERRNPGTSVIVAGLHGSIVGIGQGARATSNALRRAGLDVYDWDLSEIYSHPRRLEAGDPTPPDPGPGTIIVQINARELVDLVAKVGAGPFAGKRCIGYWAWELETIPNTWLPAFRYVDEIWTPSDFTSDAIRKAAPRRIKVHTVHHPIDTPAAAPSRARFDLPETGAIVLAALDIRSGMARKNPMAAISAFEAATRHDPSSAVLVLKVGGIKDNEALFESLQARAMASPNIRIVTEHLTDEDRDRLVTTADIVLSLHRSEGFGLLMAEAMLAGKPVVATGWSGNLDFMSADSARLVPYDLIPVVDPQSLFTHGRWADADVAAAADHLRQLIADPALCRTLGEAGRRHAQGVLDTDRIARQAAGRLGIGATRQASGPGSNDDLAPDKGHGVPSHGPQEMR